MGARMAFVTEKEELQAGLIIFRRGDVDHRRWYCRIKLPKADRYKTISLKTSDKDEARKQALQQNARVEIKLEANIAVFNRSFSQVAKEYAALQDDRLANREISEKRADLVRDTINNQLNRYIGTTQVHLIGPERWTGYPAWRRRSGQGRIARLGSTRPFTPEEKAAEDARMAAAEAQFEVEAERAARVGRKLKKKPPVRRNEWVNVSDSTIRTEMSIFRAIMAHAVSKRYVSSEKAFGAIPDQLDVMRRDEFNINEYRALHSKGRAWVRAANPNRPLSVWTRTVAYNFILIMCSTGMRPPEAKNLRWRDISPATDREGREIVVLWVRGKDKHRKLVAPKSVGDFLQRIREVTERLRPHIPIMPDQPVFTTFTGDPADSLYSGIIEGLLKAAGLHLGPTGVPRGNYCFRHTYATFRLSEGVDVYFLAEQMGTSVKMIEDHYGHVNTIRHADRVLQGMHLWNPEGDDDSGDKDQAALPATTVKQRRGRADRTKAATRQAIKTKQPKLAAPKARPGGRGKPR